MAIDVVGKHLTAYFVLISSIVAALPAVLIGSEKIPTISETHSAFQQVLVSIFSILTIAFVISCKKFLSADALVDKPLAAKFVRAVPALCVAVMLICVERYFDVVNNRSEATNLTWPIFAFSGMFVMPTLALSLLGIWEYKQPPES